MDYLCPHKHKNIITSMKKLVLAIAAISIVSVAQAQENTVNTFKPQAKEVTAELGLAGGLLNTNSYLADGGLLKGRYFLTNQSALRFGVSIVAENEKENFYRGTSSAKGVFSETTTNVDLSIGYEKHFNGTSRLSPYVGADLMLGFGSMKEKGTDTDGMVYDDEYSFETKASAFRWGLRGVVGADYYFVKNVYVGVEAGLGFFHTIQGKSSSETTISGVTTSVEYDSPGSSFEFNPSVTTGVRLGFVF